MDPRLLILASVLAIFLMALLIALSGVVVGYHPSRTKMTRTEHEAMITAVLAALVCDVLIHHVAEAMKVALSHNFDLLLLGFGFGLFTVGALFGSWWMMRTHPPRI